MTRRLLNLLTLLSLVLFLMTGALWVRSYWANRGRPGGFPGDEWIFRTGFVGSFEGRLAVEWCRQLGPPTRALGDDAFSAWGFQSPRWDFELRRYRGLDGDNPNRQYTFLAVPHWFPMLLLAPLPAWCLRQAVRRRRRDKPAGFCVHCGYDLTGNVSGVCPECGAPSGRGTIPAA